ncbi:MAG: hypothetical protein PUC82_04095 [bacterium]|nr:hypothetical protein [bacterium]
MTVLENIRICDNGYRELQEKKPAQKIKLRNASYATISAQYMNSMEKNLTPPVKEETSSVEITSVIAINPAVAAMINLLEIEGKISSVGHKALKVKPTMYDNMKKNSASQKDLAIATEHAQIIPPEPAVEIPHTLEISESLDELDKFKVSKNATSAAKVEKYTEQVTEQEEKTIVTPTQTVPNTTLEATTLTIEEKAARPVSRIVPLVTPERIVKEEQKETEKSVNASPATINLSEIANITDLEVLREYLAKTAQLKAEAEKAKREEEEAKENAARAEQEAANSRKQLVQTAEMIAAHQETLIAQTEQSHNQASIYDARRDEFEAERDEYQKAINDMLAIMDDKTEETKTRTL